MTSLTRARKRGEDPHRRALCPGGGFGRTVFVALDVPARPHIGRRSGERAVIGQRAATGPELN
jgi:hypothetical protein